MGYAVVHMQKIKAGGVRGIQSHNNREHTPRTNPDINPEKTADNYNLLPERNYSRKIKEIIKSQATETKTVRKDAVVMCNFIVTSDNATIAALGATQQRVFFEKSLAWFSARYGAENIVNATVHMDETTPHLHIGVVPIKNQRLSAKNLFTRKELTAIQTDFVTQVGAKFGLERGKEGSENKHLSEQQFKLETTKREISTLQKNLDDLGSALQKVHRLTMAEEKRANAYQTTQDTSSVKTLPGGNVLVKKKDYQALLEISKIYAANFSVFQDIRQKQAETALSFATAKGMEQKARKFFNKQANLSANHEKLLKEHHALKDSMQHMQQNLQNSKEESKKTFQLLESFQDDGQQLRLQVKTLGKGAKKLLENNNLTEEQENLIKGMVYYAGCRKEPAEISKGLARYIPKTKKQLENQYKQTCLKLEKMQFLSLDERIAILGQKSQLEKALGIKQQAPEQPKNNDHHLSKDKSR